MVDQAEFLSFFLRGKRLRVCIYRPGGIYIMKFAIDLFEILLAREKDYADRLIITNSFFVPCLRIQSRYLEFKNCEFPLARFRVEISRQRRTVCRLSCSQATRGKKPSRALFMPFCLYGCGTTDPPPRDNSFLLPSFVSPSLSPPSPPPRRILASRV